MTSSRKEKPEADVVIIGSGGGTAAAVAAAEKGASVIVPEKQGVLGGNTRQANGLWACESPVQKRENIVRSSGSYSLSDISFSTSRRLSTIYRKQRGETVIATQSPAVTSGSSLL